MRMPQLAAVVAATLLLAACGGGPLDGKSGPEVVTAAADALEAAGAVHIAGDLEEDGQEGKVDLHLQGDDVTGTLTIDGAEMELLSVEGTFYLKGTPEFWASFGMPEAMSAMFQDQWVQLPAGAAGEFTTFSLDGFIEELRNPDSSVKDDVRTDEVDGKDVVIAEQEDGRTLTVTNDEKAYPLEMSGGDTPGGITFSRFGEKEDISAPENALDLDDLMGGA